MKYFLFVWCILTGCLGKFTINDISYDFISNHVLTLDDITQLENVIRDINNQISDRNQTANYTPHNHQCSGNFEMDSRPRCKTSGLSVTTCECKMETFENRHVYFSIPSSWETYDEEHGFPTVMVYHGWGIEAISAFVGAPADIYVRDLKVKVVAELLHRGFAVVAPSAGLFLSEGDGGFWAAWQTNIAPYNKLDNWEESHDHKVLSEVWRHFPLGESGKFGVKLNLNKMHATGFSSGGFMTSRMGFSYPGKFLSLSINGGSFYDCGATCSKKLTDEEHSLLDQHPPTQIFHGEMDTVVWPSSSEEYNAELSRRINVQNRRMEGRREAHKWLDVTPEEIPNWISTFN